MLYPAIVDAKRAWPWFALLIGLTATAVWILAGGGFLNFRLATAVNCVIGVAGGLVGLASRTLRFRIIEREQQRAESELVKYRETILRDIHDTVSPALAGIGLQAELGATSGLTASEMQSLLSRIQVNVRTAHGQLHEALGALRIGNSLFAQPLVELIEAAQRDGLRVTGDWSVSIDSVIMKSLVNRLVSELLANAKRYSSTSGLSLCLSRFEDVIVVQATNPFIRPPGAAGFGLANLTHLIESAGGSLSWTAEHGLFEVVAEIPLQDDGSQR